MMARQKPNRLAAMSNAYYLHSTRSSLKAINPDGAVMVTTYYAFADGVFGGGGKT